MTASKAAAMIRIMTIKNDRDPRFIAYVIERITRG